MDSNRSSLGRIKSGVSVTPQGCVTIGAKPGECGAPAAGGGGTPAGALATSSLNERLAELAAATASGDASAIAKATVAVRNAIQDVATAAPPDGLSLEEWTKKQSINVVFPDPGARERERAAERALAVQLGIQWDQERKQIEAEERARLEMISKHNQLIPTGVKIWNGTDIDAGTSGMSIDDAWASYAWYTLYGSTPTERGGTTKGSEKANVDRWAEAAKRRYNELTFAGVTQSPLWGAFKGAAESIWNNPLVVYNPLIATLTAGIRFWMGVPQSIEEMQTKAEMRTKLLIEGGLDPHTAGAGAFILAVGDLLPSNKLVESISGTSLADGRPLTAWERTKRGGEFVVETILLALGAQKPAPVKKPVSIVGESAESITVSPVAKPTGSGPTITVPVRRPFPTGWRYATPAEESLIRAGYVTKPGTTKGTGGWGRGPDGRYIVPEGVEFIQKPGTRLIYKAPQHYVEGEAIHIPGLPVGAEVPLRPMRPPTPYAPRPVASVPKGPAAPGFQWVFENGAWVQKRFPPQTEFQVPGEPGLINETPTGWRVLPADEAAYYFRTNPGTSARKYGGVTIVPIEGYVLPPLRPGYVRTAKEAPAGWGYSWNETDKAYKLYSPDELTIAFPKSRTPAMPAPSVPFKPLEPPGIKFRPHSDGTWEVVVQGPQAKGLTQPSPSPIEEASIPLTREELLALQDILVPFPGRLHGRPSRRPPPEPRLQGPGSDKEKLAQQIRDSWALLFTHELALEDRRVIVGGVIALLREYLRG